MNFLYPAFLLGGLAVAIPIVLHLLRRDVAPDVPFTAVRLLTKSPVERSRRRSLRDILLLAARVAALLLLAAAFARPFAPSAASAMQPLTIIGIDRSFSMGAPGGFERALQMARAAVDETGFGERVAVIAFDDRAEVIAQPGAAADAKLALGGVSITSGGTRFASVINKAAELATGGAARLIVISDLQRAGWEGHSRTAVPTSLKVEARDAGGVQGNAGVIGGRVNAKGVVASIRNAGDGDRRGVVTLTRDGSEFARAPYTVGGHATVDVPLAWMPSPGGVTISIDDSDGFPADNARHLVVGGVQSSAVLVVTSMDAAGFYLERALDAAHADAVSPLSPRLISPAQIAGGRAADVATHRAVALLSTRGLDRSARDAITAFVRGGGGLLVAAGPDLEPEVVSGMFGWKQGTITADGNPRAASFTATDARHPIFRPFGPLAANLGQVRFTRAWQLDPQGWQIAAQFDDGRPAVMERAEGSGRVVLFASDLDRRWNDFPLHPSFVPFVVETLRHVAARQVEVDQFLVGRTPAGVNAAPGLHRLPDGRLIAVNVDPGETATGVMTPAEFVAMLDPIPQAPQQQAAREEQTESRQSLWRYGLFLMLATLVVESFIGRAS
jgi:hypothetical protein